VRITDTSDLWWKSAVIYCLDVETYLDSDGDGCGDLEGLAHRIDYLAELGITCLWLMPFYPSPDRDDGYDITDYYGVDPRLGNHGQLVEVIRTAHDRGIRVIADLVVNHTSDQHPWFKQARRSKDSPYRDYYVWRDTQPPDTSDQVVFPDQEEGIWAYDERTGEWYLHHFYSHQPDLNVSNPKVREEILRTIGFWLELGIDGFRMDAVPFFLNDEGHPPGEELEPHTLLRATRDFVGRRKGSAMLLGEVNLPQDQILPYFGGETGGELDMMFDFTTMQATYLSLARGDTGPLLTALRGRPELPPTCQWANFLRNHDELTLDQLTEEERQEVFAAFGPEEEMQLYGRGLKRRLPTMLGGDPRRVRMAYSLMFALPGTPTLYYGEEIGMGEDLEAPGRMAVRTPMQWSAEENGGFSAAPARRLVQRTVPDGYGPQHVNVADQKYVAGSLWTFLRKLVHARRTNPEIGWGETTVIEQDDAAVLALRADLGDSAIVTVHNLSPDPATLVLDLPELEEDWRLQDALEDEPIVTEDGHVDIALEGYGARWLRLSRTAAHRI
jgi:trehalose synthase